MKKLIAMMLIIAMLFICVGCGDTPAKTTNHPLENRFEQVYKDECWHDGWSPCTYFRDRETDVVYTTFNGGFTPLFNADGTPILWSEIQEEMK